MRCYNAGRTNDKQLKIELLSQWKLEAEFRNKTLGAFPGKGANEIRVKVIGNVWWGSGG